MKKQFCATLVYWHFPKQERGYREIPRTHKSESLHKTRELAIAQLNRYINMFQKSRDAGRARNRAAYRIVRATVKGV